MIVLYVIQFLMANKSTPRRIIKSLLSKDGMLLRFLSEELRGDKELQLIAVRQNPEAFEHCHYSRNYHPSFFCGRVDEAVLEELMDKRPDIGAKVFYGCMTPCSTKEQFYKILFLKAIKKHGVSFFEDLWNMYCEGTYSNFFNLEDNNRPSHTFFMEDGPSQYYPFNSRKIMGAAVRSNWKMITYADIDVQEGLVKVACRRNGHALQYMLDAFNLEEELRYLKKALRLNPKIVNERWFKKRWSEVYVVYSVNKRLPHYIKWEIASYF